MGVGILTKSTGVTRNGLCFCIVEEVGLLVDSMETRINSGTTASSSQVTEMEVLII